MNPEDDPLQEIADRRRQEVEDRQRERHEDFTKVAESASDAGSILADEEGLCHLTIDPRFLPYTAILGNELVEQMRKRYSLDFKGPTVAGPTGLGARDLSEEEIAALPRYVNANNIKMTFENGIVNLQFKRQEFNIPTHITEIEFTRESISVLVKGRSDAAELIAKECWEILWEIANDQVPKTFEELQSEGLQLLRYANTTSVYLKGNPKGLLSENFNEFLIKKVSTSDGYASKMIANTEKAHKGKIQMPSEPVYYLQDMQINVNIPTPSGDARGAPIMFNVRRRSDENTNSITISSQLPYSDHVNFVEEISEIVSST